MDRKHNGSAMKRKKVCLLGIQMFYNEVPNQGVQEPDRRHSDSVLGQNT